MKNSTERPRVAIVGAGLGGAFLAYLLGRRGFRVTVFEKRRDPREGELPQGRSISLGLSKSTLDLFQSVGLGEPVQNLAIDLEGRVFHTLEGECIFERYQATAGEATGYLQAQGGGRAISRAELSRLLIENAVHATFLFQHRLTDVDLDQGRLCFKLPDGSCKEIQSEIIVGADGVFSTLRGKMQEKGKIRVDQQISEVGYKAFLMPPGADGGFAMQKNAVHIWPRNGFILFGLPMASGAFACALFLATKGCLDTETLSESFESLTQREEVIAFFKKEFPDAALLIPDYVEQFFRHPSRDLISLKCTPWISGRAVLLGDACHAMLPFAGQGANNALQDAAALAAHLENYAVEGIRTLEGYAKERQSVADRYVDSSWNIAPILLHVIGAFVGLRAPVRLKK